MCVPPGRTFHRWLMRTGQQGGENSGWEKPGLQSQTTPGSTSRAAGTGAASGNWLDRSGPPCSHCGNGHSSPSSPSCCERHRCARVRQEALEGRRPPHNPHGYQVTWTPFFLALSPASHPTATQTCDMLLQTAWVPLARVRGPTCALWNVVTIEGSLMAPHGCGS